LNLEDFYIFINTNKKENKNMLKNIFKIIIEEVIKLGVEQVVEIIKRFLGIQ